MSIVIAAAVRTPIGSFQGVFSPLKASELGAVAVREVVARAGLAPQDIDLLYMGNVLSAGMGQAPARQAAIYGGLDKGTQTVTISKVCGSGLEAVIQGARALSLGDADIVVAGGMESMTNAPYLLPGARGGLRMGQGQLVDSMMHDGLWDIYNDKLMGNCADMCAAKYSFSREAQDAFAITSYERAQAAMSDGTFAREIVPVEVRGRKETITVSQDEEPERVKFGKIPKLRPAFDKEGTVTAANASTINDGAAALILTTQQVAKERGLNVLAHINGYAGFAQEPEWFTTAPVGAMTRLYDKLGWSADSVDLYEINEAFAVVPMAAMAEFDIPHERVNVHGGAVALGHPLGTSGARILVTLLNALQTHGKKRGVASICIGGGEALALGLELA